MKKIIKKFKDIFEFNQEYGFIEKGLEIEKLGPNDYDFFTEEIDQEYYDFYFAKEKDNFMNELKAHKLKVQVAQILTKKG